MRISRTAPATPTAPVDPLSSRRSRVLRTRVEAVQAVAEADTEIVPCPTDSNLLLDILMSAPRDRRVRRPGDFLHVSDMLNGCVRKVAIANKFSIPLGAQRLSLSDILTFAQGDAIHDALKALATKGSPGRVWGRWKCKCGHLHHEEPCCYDETDPDDICERCGTPTNEYEEVPMRDPDTMIVGTPDLILYLREYRAYHITELKSIADNQFQELVRPKPDHVLQVLFYWYLMNKLGYRLTDKVSILYATKGYQFGAQNVFKEYMLDPQAEMHRLEPYLADARALKASREGADALPVRHVCKGEFTAVAKKCECWSLCWKMD